LSRSGRAWSLIALTGLLGVLAAIVPLEFLGRSIRLGVSGEPGAVSQCDAGRSVSATPDMVWVPGGAFEMGDPLDPGEAPGRAVETAGFWMDRTEVTNAQFARFVQATGYMTEAERARQDQASRAGVVSVFRQPESVLGREDTSQWWAISREATWRQPSGRGSSVEGREAFPVVAVTYADASAYAQWLGRSLPSEIQWERAARLGSTAGNLGSESVNGAGVKAAGNTWQGLFPVLDAAADGHAGLAPVGCYTPNEMGVHDLIGNVWELTQDAYLGSGQLGAMIASTTSPGAMSRSGAGERKVSAHVIKGGSYLCSEDFCARARAGSRQPLEDGMAAVHVGFRTISGAPGPRSELGTGKSLGAVDQ